eukprot:4277268-Amphidinium_carterae.1
MHGLSRLVSALENSTVSDATDLDEPMGMVMQAPPLHKECGKLETLRRIWSGWTLSECCSVLLTSTPLTPKHSLGPYWLTPNNARFVRPDERVEERLRKEDTVVMTYVARHGPTVRLLGEEIYWEELLEAVAAINDNKDLEAPAGAVVPSIKLEMKLDPRPTYSGDFVMRA